MEDTRYRETQDGLCKAADAYGWENQHIDRTRKDMNVNRLLPSYTRLVYCITSRIPMYNLLDFCIFGHNSDHQVFVISSVVKFPQLKVIDCIFATLNIYSTW